MRRCSVLLTAWLIFGFGTAFAGDATKDAVALSNVEMSISAMGGDSAVLAIKDSVFTGTITPAKGSWSKPASFVWKTSGPEFRCEVTGDSGTQIFASGHGKPAVSRKGEITALFYHMAQGAPPFQLPAFVLSSKMSDPAYSLTDAGSGKLSGKDAVEVQTSSSLNDAVAAITQQTWYIDPSSGLPLRVEYRLPAATDIQVWLNAAMEFSDFRKVGDLLVPYAMTYYEEGIAVNVFSVSTVEFNVGIDPSEFDLLGGGK